MTVTDNTLTIRPITGRTELELFCKLPYVLNEELASDLDAGRRRPEWMWVALRGDRVVARVAWWGRAHDDMPCQLDVLDADDVDVEPDRVDLLTTLLKVAMAEVVPAGSQRPEWGRFLRPDWREHEPTARGVGDRMEALTRLGACPLVERLRLEWLPGTVIAEATQRLAFRPFVDSEEVIALMTSALEGTLDAHSRQDLKDKSALQVAIGHFEGELDRYSTPRDWWQVATLPDGVPVGFVMPAHNDYHAIIAYIGVLPEHRGRGYVDEILAEGTRVLAAQDVPRVRASTDCDNAPMAAAFARAGWTNFERSINMTW